MRIAKHIGVVAVSAEGAALCYRTICLEGAKVLGPHSHPEVTMHTIPLAEYMRYVEGARWEEAGRLLLSSAKKLAAVGAELLVCPDNTLHQALDLVRGDSPAAWLHIAEEVATIAAERGFKTTGYPRHPLPHGRPRLSSEAIGEGNREPSPGGCGSPTDKRNHI